MILFLLLILSPADEFCSVPTFLSASSLRESMWVVEVTQSISGVGLRPELFYPERRKQEIRCGVAFLGFVPAWYNSELALVPHSH